MILFFPKHLRRVPKTGTRDRKTLDNLRKARENTNQGKEPYVYKILEKEQLAAGISRLVFDAPLIA
ncbi:MAG TPA: hypothetical protein VIV61_03245, partial [Candidatus Ozemobacteraceae bacterium]